MEKFDRFALFRLDFSSDFLPKKRAIPIIICIITSSDDIQPSTLLSNQSPSGLIL